MAATKIKIKSNSLKRVREKEITQPIYTGSLYLKLHPVPRTTTGFH